MKEYKFYDIDDSINDYKGDLPNSSDYIDNLKNEGIRTLFPEVMKFLKENNNKTVISIAGGSGVGKSTMARLLAYQLDKNGLNSYIMSGDNYPIRIPIHNDGERLRLFRSYGYKAIAESNLLTTFYRVELLDFQEKNIDSDPTLINNYPFMANYQTAGKQALESYLGSNNELEFDEVNKIINNFKNNKATMLKRMGRSSTSTYYENVDLSKTQVLILEWTHGISKYLKNLDICILLNSTPQETLRYRALRNRDGGIDSPFTKMVLEIEQNQLHHQAKRADIILSKENKLLTYSQYLDIMAEKNDDNGVMLNCYPDSLGPDLNSITNFLANDKVVNSFKSLYLLPSIFNSDLDRGFSIIDYQLNKHYSSKQDLQKIKQMGLDLKFDLILNHASVYSPQFQDILKNGEKSQYLDFFIDWNNFWQGFGKMNQDGYIQPDDKYLKDMYFRKAGLPILKVKMPDGKEKAFWNTFYQEIQYHQLTIDSLLKNTNMQYLQAKTLVAEVNPQLVKGFLLKDLTITTYPEFKNEIVKLLEANKSYLGQMDLNIKSKKVWDFYQENIEKLASYGAKIIRLDAFAYASKVVGKKNFFNENETWDILERLNLIAREYNIKLLPEIHSRYEEKIHEKIAEAGYYIYDFFLPGLLIDAIENHNGSHLKDWFLEIINKDFKTVNMLGCHDGIPLLDLKGLLDDQAIEKLITTIVDRGGLVKDLHGKKNIYYQVNSTYYSALGEDDSKMLLARAIQMFAPGKAQVYYLDLFAGKNDFEAVKKAGTNGHKEINRTNLSEKEIEAKLQDELVIKQLELIRLKNTHEAFIDTETIDVKSENFETIEITHTSKKASISLKANLKDYTYSIITN